MKKVLLFLCLFFCLNLTSTVAAGPISNIPGRAPTHLGGSWVVETVDIGFVGEFNSLAMDSMNRAHISYFYLDDLSLRYASKMRPAYLPLIFRGE